MNTLVDVGFEEDGDDKNIVNVMEVMNEVNLKDLMVGTEIHLAPNTAFVEKTDEELQDEIFVSRKLEVIDTFMDLKRKAGIQNTTNFKKLAEIMTNVPDEDGLVKKYILQEGSGNLLTEDQQGQIHYNIYENGSADPTDSTLEGKPVTFRLSNAGFLTGMVMALQTMKKGESSLFLIHWSLMYGQFGCPPRIREKSDILLEVSLLNIIDTPANIEDIDKLDFKERMEEVGKIRELGNVYFKKEHYKSAFEKYYEVLKSLNQYIPKNENEELVMNEMRVKAANNAALTCRKLKRPKQACCYCQEVLAIDSRNMKALFNYGVALTEIKSFPEAKKHLKRAQALNPNDTEISKALDELYQKEKFELNREKEFSLKAIQIKKLAPINKTEEPKTVEENTEMKKALFTFKQSKDTQLILPSNLRMNVETLKQMVNDEELTFKKTGKTIIVMKK